MAVLTEYLNFVEDSFDKCFLCKGYLNEEAVDITSQIDPTIDFIGSKISPLKKYVLAEDIPVPGYYLIQNCIKLKSLKTILSAERSMFGSYYKCMGTLACPDLKASSEHLFEYLTAPEYLGILPEDICIRISSRDTDLMDAISGIDGRIKREVDARELCHYRHKYGMEQEHITGRDFNVGIRKNGTDLFVNCATLVVMEREGEAIGVDMGIGNLSLSMCRFEKNSTVASSRMADIISIDSVEAEKFADALIVAATLLKENILEHPSGHFRKKYRQYLNAALFWNQTFGYSMTELTNIMIQYLTAEYQEDFSAQFDRWVVAVRAHAERRS